MSTVPPLCQICQHPGEEFCADHVACNYRARARLGVPKPVRDKLRRAETGLPPLPERPLRSQGEAPPPAGGFRFCDRHRSWFCPCVAPGLYDTGGTEAWEA